MSKKTVLEKKDKTIHRLYMLIWCLACPLAYVIALLAGFQQINIVYWTLLAVPVLLAIYNIRHVPPVRKKAEKPVEVPAPSPVQVPQASEEPPATEATEPCTAEEETSANAANATLAAPLPPPQEKPSLAQEDEAAFGAADGISHTQRIKLLALAFKAPIIIAFPILATLLVAIFIS